MMKWIGRSIYILVLLFISVSVYRIAYTAKLQNYYEAEIKDNMDDQETLLRGLNTLLTINYYRESPVLYHYESATGDYQFDLSTYAIGITADKKPYNGMMFVINNIKIKKNGELLENPIIKMSVTLSDATLLVNKDFSNTGSVYYDPAQPFSIYNVPALFLFDAENYLQVPDTTDQFASIEKITLEYSDGKLNNDKELLFDEVMLFVGSKTEYQGAAHFKDNSFAIDQSFYQINAQFGADGLTQDDIDNFNLVTEQDDLSPYNGAIWSILSIYVVAVSVVTYFLFFHKYVRARLQAKKEESYQGSSNNKSETIFKDEPFDSKKDGK